MRLVAIIALILLATVACAADLRVVGTDLLAAALAPAAATYARRNDLAVTLDLRGSRPGLEALRAGHADLALLFFAPGETPPVDQFACRPIAYQTVVVLVPAALPLAQINFEQLQGIYSASAPAACAHWGELGLAGDWAARPVVPRALSPAVSLVFPLFRETVLPGARIRSSVEFVEKHGDLFLPPTTAPGVIAIAAQPPADAAVRVLAVASGKAQPACLPTPENAHDGSYPLAFPLYAVFRRGAGPQLVLLLKHLLGEEGVAVMAQARLMPLPLVARSQLAFDLEELVAAGGK